MIFTQDRNRLRAFFAQAWRGYRDGVEQAALERLVAEVVAEHPEYHALLDELAEEYGRQSAGEDRDSSHPAAVERAYAPAPGATNPFLHLGMHIAIREQLATDRPAGIVATYRSLAGGFASVHELEHAMMDCLGEVLWEAQRAGRGPDEQAYLDCLRRLVRARRIRL